MSSTTAASVSVVLVHGGFVDGSGWEKVYQSLKKDGYPVSKTRRSRWPMTSRSQSVSSMRKVLRSSLSAIPMAEW